MPGQEHRYLLGNAIALQPVLERVLQSECRKDRCKTRSTALAFLSQTQIRLLDTDGNTIARLRVLRIRIKLLRFQAREEEIFLLLGVGRQNFQRMKCQL